MTLNGWLQIALYCVVIVLLTKPLGGYMTRVFNGERTLLSPLLRPIERGLYAIAGVDETRRAALDQPTPSPCWFSASPGSSRFMRCNACKACRCPSIRKGLARHRARQRLQHLRQLRLQHQLAVLCAGSDDELSRRRWPG